MKRRAHGVYLAQQGRRAGSAEKTDALQAFIIKTVQAHLSITLKQLVKKLKLEARLGGDFIEQVDEDNNNKITFVDTNDRLKDASMSGLKDRLSRAKKSLK